MSAVLGAVRNELKIATANTQSLAFVDKFFYDNSVDFKKVYLPTKLKRFVLLKSPHVNKKAKEHFQIKKYKRLYQVNFPSEKIMKDFLLASPNDLSIVIKKMSTGNTEESSKTDGLIDIPAEKQY